MGQLYTWILAYLAIARQVLLFLYTIKIYHSMSTVRHISQRIYSSYPT